MIEYFNKSEYEKAKKQKKLILGIYFGIAVIFAAFAVLSVIYAARLPYQSPKIGTVKWVLYPATGVFVIFSFIYLGIPYKKVKKFAAFCNNLVFGLKEESVADFFEYDETLQDNGGVDCKSLVFLEWNKYKKDYFERKVLVFYEKDFPIIPEKARVKFITQGNFLISYEVIQENKGE